MSSGAVSYASGWCSQCGERTVFLLERETVTCQVCGHEFRFNDEEFKSMEWESDPQYYARWILRSVRRILQVPELESIVIHARKIMAERKERVS